MSRLAFAVALLTLVLLACGVAHASFTDYSIYLKATDEHGACGPNGRVIFGTKTGASDGIDFNDASAPIGSGSGVCMGFFNMGPGANGYGWSKDFAAPPRRDGHWLLKLWLEPGCTADRITLTGWNPSGTYAFDWSELHLNPIGDPTGTFGTTEPVYTWNRSCFGTETDPQFTIVIANAQAARGLNNAITFMCLPEPGSVMGLLAGCAGLAAFALRRRRP